MSGFSGRNVSVLFAVSVLLAVPLLLPSFPASAAPDDAWWFRAMKVGRAHAAGFTGDGVKVAVIDGAIDTSVPELRGADIRLGKSITGRKTRSTPSYGAANHGTAMTVLIAGQGNGGVTGIAPDAEVTFYSGDDDPRDKAKPSDFGPLIDEAVADGADIISISMTSGYPGVWEATDRAIAKNVVVVAGGGPAGSKYVLRPATIDGVVGVGAVDRNAKPWPQQPGREGGSLTISAPGVEVEAGGMTAESTGARWVPSFRRTGTSPATAITAGALALVKEKYPNATGNQLIQQLVHNVGREDDKPYFAFRKELGFGIVSVGNMLETDPTGWPDENPLVKGNRRAMKDYPLSIYRDPKKAIPSQSATPDPSTSSAGPGGASGEESSGDESGLGWLPLAAGLGLLAAAAGGAWWFRRRGRGEVADS